MDQSSHHKHEFQLTSSAQTRTSQNPVSQEQTLESNKGDGIGDGDGDGTGVKSSARSLIYNSDSDSDSDSDSNGSDELDQKISDEEEWKRTQAEWDEQIEDHSVGAEAGAGATMDTFLTQVDDRGEFSVEAFGEAMGLLTQMQNDDSDNDDDRDDNDSVGDHDHDKNDDKNDEQKVQLMHSQNDCETTTPIPSSENDTGDSQELESTEDTLLVEDSQSQNQSQSPTTSTDANADTDACSNSSSNASPLEKECDQIPEEGTQESSNAWKGFTEDDADSKVDSDGIDKMNLIVNSSDPGGVVVYDAKEDIDVEGGRDTIKKSISFDAMQPGFTEDSDVEENNEMERNDHVNVQDTNTNNHDVDVDVANDSRGDDEENLESSTSVSIIHTTKQGDVESAVKPCDNELPQDEHENMDHDCEDEKCSMPASPENTLSPEKSIPTPKEIENDAMDQMSENKVNDIVEKGSNPEETSSKESIKEMAMCESEKGAVNENHAIKEVGTEIGPASVNKHEKKDVTNHLSIFTGDTQPVPSQFPLTFTLQEEVREEDHRTDVDGNKVLSKAASSTDIVEKDSSVIAHSPTVPDVDKSFSYPTGGTGTNSDHTDTNDSFYGASTEGIQVRNGSILEREKDKLILTSTSTRSETVNGNHADLKKCAEKQSSVLQSAQLPSRLRVDEEILTPLEKTKKEGNENEMQSPNRLGTPNDDVVNLGLSYPRDYLSNENSQEISKSCSKALSGSETLTITPHSQILLDPVKTLKTSTFCIVEKVADIQSKGRNQNVNVDDEICNSSDEENENVDQHGESDETETAPSRNDDDDQPAQQPGQAKISNLELVSSPSRRTVRKESLILKSPLSTKSHKSEDEDDNIVHDSTQADLSSPSRIKRRSLNIQEKVSKSDTEGGWLKKRPQKSPLRIKRENRRHMSDEEDDQIENSMKNLKETNFESQKEDDSIEAFENSTPLSDLVDTQPDECKDEEEHEHDDDDDDDVPLSALKNKPRSLKKPAVSALESSDEENEFTWEAKVQPSQTTRAIKSQLLKFENSFDVKTLEKRLKEAQESKAIISSNKKMKILTNKNAELKKANTQLSREKEALRKELDAANAKMKEKNDLLAQLTTKLDSYQPILEAVKNLGLTQNFDTPKKSLKTPQQRSRKKIVQKKNIRKKPFKNDDGDAGSETEVDNSSAKEVFHTPKMKKPAVQKVNVISGSTKKKYQKPSNYGNMTFSSLWKVLQNHGWKHKSGPEPYNKVYVPPDGSVRLGSKLGIHFFEANALWTKAEELGLIDGHDESDHEEIETALDKTGIKRTGINSPQWRTKSPQESISNIETVTPVREHETLNDDAIKEFDNTMIHRENGTMTEDSLRICTTVFHNFFDLGSSGHFMRNLFGPIWDCLSQKQNLIVKNLGWGYCKSVRKGSENLGRDHWFCPPGSKGSKGFYGKDYFTTEEAVIAQILRELKAYEPFTKYIGKNDEVVNVLEIKLSRAIEQHIPYDEVKNTAVSTSKRSRRQHAVKSTSVTNVEKISPATKRKKLEHGDSDEKSKSSASDASSRTLQTRNKSPATSPVEASINQKSHDTSEKMIFSQKTVEGAEMLLQLNKEFISKEDQNDYDNIITMRGVEELIKFRRRVGAKRKLDGEKEDRESPPKRERISPDAMCHLTQAPEDTDVSSFTHATPRRWSQKDLKKLPLSGLFFFGSGVNDEIRKKVHSLGGTFLENVQQFLLKNKTKQKLFFLSNVKSRRTHKYVLACALGVPMLDMEWLLKLEKEFKMFKEEDGSKMPGAFDNSRFSRYRLPLGLSNETGLFSLQRASNAKHWKRPMSEPGKLLFDGIKVVISLEKAEFEKKWADIMRIAGATLLNSSDMDKKGKGLHHVDIILVDSLQMPPHVTAVPPRLGKVLNKAASHQPHAIVIDLSWATQCLVRRQLLETDDDKRFRVDLSSQNRSKTPNKNRIVEIFSIKVKQYDSLTRYEVGDSVKFGRAGNEACGRITSISYHTKTRKTTVTLKVLEVHKEIEVIDGGKGVNSVEIDESELLGHIVVLSGKDFGDVAWSKASNVYRQKKV